MEEVQIYVTNIEQETLQNPHYRKVLFTTSQMQLVAMKLYPGENIPTEKHRGTQFVRIEAGLALVIVEGERFTLRGDDIVMIPAHTEHYFENIGTEPLSLYSIYSPPEHRHTLVQYQPEGSASLF